MRNSSCCVNYAIVAVAVSLSGVGAPAHAFDVASQVSQSVTRNIADAINRNVQYQMIRPELLVRNSAGEIRYLGSSPDGKLLAVVMADDSLRVWDTEIGLQRFRANLSGSPASAVLATPKLVVVGHENGQLIFHDNQNGAELRSVDAHSGAVKALAVSPDGAVLASTGTDGSVKLWSLDSFKLLRTIQPSAAAVSSLAISPDGKKLLTGEASGGSHVWNMATGEELSSLANLEGPVVSVQFANQGEQAAVATASDVGVGDVNSRSVDPARIGTRGVTAYSGNQAAHIAVVGTDSGQVRMIDLSSKSVIKEFKPISQAIRHLVYDDARKRIVFAGDDGVLRMISADSGTELLQIMMTRAGWAVLDAEGRYDASEQGMNDVIWKAGSEELPLEQFSKFFEPGLLGAYSVGGGNGLRNIPGAVQSGIALPPKLEVEFPDGSMDASVPQVEVKVVAHEQGGGIGEVRLYHNGKLTAPGTQYKQEDSGESDHPVRTLFYRIKPVPGFNTFKAVGSGLYDIEGYSQKVSRNFAGAEPPSTLHVLVVGISRYQDSQLNLDYSVADASAIADNLGRMGRGLFQEVREHRLLDAEASSAHILETLAALDGQAGPNDVVVVYLAGHGLVVGDEWRFLPYETRYQRDVSGYAGQGVAASQLYDALVKISPQRMLLLIDSCHSGATAESFRDQERFQRRFLRDVGRTAGVTVLAAARKDQVAAEMSTLKHGLFTYVLISGLGGKADTQPSDGSVTAHELVGYAAQSIPDFSRKYIHYRQEPAAFALGADFRIAR